MSISVTGAAAVEVAAAGRGPDLVGLCDALEAAVFAAYALEHGLADGTGSVREAARLVEEAERVLAEAIPPGRRSLGELSARADFAQARWEDAVGGAFLASSLRHSAVSAAKHAHRHGDTPRPGVWRCDHKRFCLELDHGWAARRRIVRRGIAPGRTVARLVLVTGAASYRRSALVRAFFADGCGGPVRGDFVEGGHEPVFEAITPADVERRMAAGNQPWRILTRDEAAAAIVEAGYRIDCAHPDHDPRHWHTFTAADAGSDTWRRSAAPDWHVEHGTWVAFVQRTRPER